MPDMSDASYFLYIFIFAWKLYISVKNIPKRCQLNHGPKEK